MLKEIYEQPKAVADTIHPRIKDGKIVIEELGLSDEDIRKISRIQMVACGSAYHVCAAAKYVLEKLSGIPVDIDLASEFRYRNPLLSEHTLVVIVSQSGETADSLAALRESKKRGFPVLGIVNVVEVDCERGGHSVFTPGPDRRFPWQRPRPTALSWRRFISSAFFSARCGNASAERKQITISRSS